MLDRIPSAEEMTARENLSENVQKSYDEAKTYLDGKWVMFEPVDTSLYDNYMKLLGIKRKPNKQ